MCVCVCLWVCVWVCVCVFVSVRERETATANRWYTVLWQNCKLIHSHINTVVCQIFCLSSPSYQQIFFVMWKPLYIVNLIWCLLCFRFSLTASSELTLSLVHWRTFQNLPPKKEQSMLVIWKTTQFPYLYFIYYSHISHLCYGTCARGIASEMSQPSSMQPNKLCRALMSPEDEF